MLIQVPVANVIPILDTKLDIIPPATNIAIGLTPNASKNLVGLVYPFTSIIHNRIESKSDAKPHVTSV